MSSKRLHQNVIVRPAMDIWIDGKEIVAKMKQNIEEIEVEELEEIKSSIAKVTIHDISRYWSNADIIKKDSSLSITLGHRGEIRRVFDGVIKSVEADYPDTGIPVMIISGIASDYDPLKERMSFTSHNEKLSYMITNWFRWLRADCEVDDTGAVLPSISVHKENVLEFCERKAKELGWNFFKTASGKYYFGRKTRRDFPVETLGYGVGNRAIKSFTPTFTELEQTKGEDEGDYGETDDGGDYDG